MTDHYDLVIVGGGLVGASLAVALRSSGLEIAVIEPHPFDSQEQPSYDERTVALTWSTRQIFQGMGIWEEIAEAGAEPILDIHVSNLGHFGMSHLSCREVGTEALGYVVPTRALGKVLEAYLQGCDSIELMRPATAESLVSDHNHCTVKVERNNSIVELTARLAVLADGGRSTLTKSFNTRKTDYIQQALLCIVRCDRPHGGRAYERFTNEGPLALLPHSKQRYAVVWTCLPEQVDQRMGMDDREFIQALQQRLGDRAGNFSDPSPRKSYPLSRSNLDRVTRERIVVIGNAAHIVHPVAGQGFNLGMRDVAALSEILFTHNQVGSDIGSVECLQQYARQRRRDTFMVGQFTHGLIEIFSSDNKILSLLRNLALSGVEVLPPAKKFLLKRTMGMAGRQPRLALGLPLTSEDASISK
ncbi:MAG: 2-octaprenyl-6-methoxyphenyl hydroxylase [Arenicellales bacterium]